MRYHEIERELAIVILYLPSDSHSKYKKSHDGRSRVADVTTSLGIRFSSQFALHFQSTTILYFCDMSVFLSATDSTAIILRLLTQRCLRYQLPCAPIMNLNF